MIFVLLQREMKKITFILVFLLLCWSVPAQVSWRTFSEQIRSLDCERMVLEIADDGLLEGTDPDNTLHIGFDEMSHDVHFYTYTIRHMNADWSGESGLLSNEYVQGFTTMDITDYAHSINTSRAYTHYRFDFPNADMALTKSGNYRLIIYEDGDIDKRVAEIDFRVAHYIAKVSGKVRTDTDIEYNGRYQQVEFDINTTGLNLRDPNELKVYVAQNNRTDNAIWVKPTFVEPSKLRYVNNKNLIFEGGNEYRIFDAFSVYYAGSGIDRMVYDMGDYHALLFPDEPMNDQYIHHFDSDGSININAENVNDVDVEAEYVWVHWFLPMAKPFFDGALYVGGDLFNNELGLRNRMEYDAESKGYWLTGLFKQGGYNYQYWFVPKNQESGVRSQEPKITTTQVDGSYWQTHNEYYVYVYWRPFGARYDQLVSVKTLH